ncbi:hypothetical protein TNCV_4999481 [Trichonephila clavipes]|uniref:Uncharacterized protein n=1 Tax=Trichonephila clavipes TaxID=2585209 RepID=A0A8X6RDY9_TRICX|nr:hypothetical protein TNCV_4999481 [Trichonephila clavipes]
MPNTPISSKNPLPGTSSSVSTFSTSSSSTQDNLLPSHLAAQRNTETRYRNKRIPHRSRNATPTEITTDDEDMITYDVEEEELEQDPFILPEGYLRALTPSRYRNYRE